VMGIGDANCPTGAKEQNPVARERSGRDHDGGSNGGDAPAVRRCTRGTHRVWNQ